MTWGDRLTSGSQQEYNSISLLSFLLNLTMTAQQEDPIRYVNQEFVNQEFVERNQENSHIHYTQTGRKEDTSYIVGSPPPFVIHNGQSYPYSKNIDPRLIGTSTHLSYPHPQYVQGSIPVITRPLMQGQVIGSQMGQSIAPGTTIIQAPTPIIKPVIYRTVESYQHDQTIQQLVNQYTLLYNKYQQLKSRGSPNDQPSDLQGQRYKTTIDKKTETTHLIFEEMLQEVNRKLNSIFSERVNQGSSAISRITEEGMRQIDQIKFY